MSSVPAEIAGIGPTAQKLRVTPGFDAMRSNLGPEEYFVLSRIDGSQSLREVLLSTGLPVERGVQIVVKLRQVGALLLPNETRPLATATTAPAMPAVQPPPPTPQPATSPPVARTPSSTRPPATIPMTGRAPTSPVVRAPTGPNSGMSHPPVPRAPTPPPAPPVELPNPTKDELAALGEDVELDVEDRRRILALRRLVDKNDPHMMLGVSQGADAKQLKRAYFRLSKEIHPDRFYGMRVGSFGGYMAHVFETISKAYAALTGNSAGSGAHKAIQQSVQTPQEFAAEVFDRACQLEVGGDALGAMKLFASAIRSDAQTRYLRRAATCALAANQPKTALEYAKKAQTHSPNDPSSARLLAAAFRAVGKLADAEDVLVMAMAMKSENDALMTELRHDLADVRRMLAAGDR
nr:J domain-containing protein [Kofleriaceae bacterium]